MGQIASAGQPPEGAQASACCFFCGRTMVNPADNVVPVLLRGEFSGKETRLRWSQRLIGIPRCANCKLSHERAVAEFGRQRFLACMLTTLLLLVCVYVPIWVLMSPEYHLILGLPAAIFLDLCICATGARLWRLIIRLVLDRDRQLKGLLCYTKPPDAFIAFPPLAEELHRGWKTYVSTAFLEGSWFWFFETCRDLAFMRPTTTGDIRPDLGRCYGAWREPSFLRILAGLAPDLSRSVSALPSDNHQIVASVLLEHQPPNCCCCNNKKDNGKAYGVHWYYQWSTAGSSATGAPAKSLTTEITEGSAYLCADCESDTLQKVRKRRRERRRKLHNPIRIFLFGASCLVGCTNGIHNTDAWYVLQVWHQWDLSGLLAGGIRGGVVGVFIGLLLVFLYFAIVLETIKRSDENVLEGICWKSIRDRAIANGCVTAIGYNGLCLLLEPKTPRELRDLDQM